MQAILPLGNDVVDIGLAENRLSAANPRYVDRVLAPQERNSPSFVPRVDRVFWAYWAAKETAYKSLIKTDPALVFAHRCFVVHPAAGIEWTAETGSATGVVVHANDSVPIRWRWQKDWVHCLTDSKTGETHYRVATLSDCRQHASFAGLKKVMGQSDASVAARSLALSLLSRCGIDDAQIVREPSARLTGPPRVMRDGQVISDVDISLSHDGRFAAAAVRVHSGEQGATAPR